jgi:predicted RNA-binding Zn ribbon-like protein
MAMAKISGGSVVAYPYTLAQLRAEFPSTSFPDDVSACDLTEFGVAHVIATSRPAEKPGEVIEEGVPALVEGEWRQTWVARAETPEELAAAKASAAAEVDADAEAARLRFITPGAGQSLEYAATEAEARAFVDLPHFFDEVFRQVREVVERRARRLRRRLP